MKVILMFQRRYCNNFPKFFVKFYYNHNLQIMKRLCLLLSASFLLLVIAIDEKCSPTNPCPTNSQCLSNNYCACNAGFISSCNVIATPLSSTSVNAALTPNIVSYFYTKPQQLDSYILFTYSICQNGPSVTMTFTLWGETGQNEAYTSSNALAAPIQTSIGGGCTSLITPYIKFGTQPNGQSELLILGITQNSATPVTISISVTQQVVIGFLIYYYILIGLGSFVAVVLVVGAVIFVKRRRRLRGMQAQNGIVEAVVIAANDISYFETVMPSCKANSLVGQKLSCPICLMQLQKNDLIRKTPCSHLFHTNCVDSWCLKNLNCPVCRFDLSLSSIKDRISENSANSERIQKSHKQEKIEQILQHPPDHIILNEEKYQIRQSML